MRLFRLTAPAALLSLLFLTACGEPKETLHIYNWGDYLSDEVVEAFEAEYNCKVQVDAFDSNEAMYAKLKAGATGYDLLVPSSYMAKFMNDQGMLAPLDVSLLPNVVKYYDATYTPLSLDPTFAYSIPYFVSFTGIGYDTNAVKNFEPTWRMFEREDLNRRCSLLNDLRETIGCALVTLGHDVNSTDPAHLAAATDLLKKWKKNIAKFEVDDAKRALASGEFFLIHTYNGDMLQVAMEQPSVSFVIPKEGATVTFDTLVIYASSEKKALAHAFIDFLYRPDQAAANMNAVMCPMAHTEAVKLVDERLKTNPAFNISAEDRARCRPLRDLGDKNHLFVKTWDNVRAD